MNNPTKMQWLQAASNQSFMLYELWNDCQRIMTLEFNQFSQTAKVLCLNTRRVFKIEKEGFLRNKTILKNEYGVEIGNFSNENWFNHEGVINLNEEKIYYTTNSKELQKMVIYKKTPKEPLVECSITSNNGDSVFNFKKHSAAEKYPALLMALVWYLFLPVVKEQMAIMADI